MDVVLLSRIQFGMTTAFHIVFPPLIIDLLFPVSENEWEQDGLIGNLSFTQWGVASILSGALGYIFYSYRVFHGKIGYGEGC